MIENYFILLELLQVLLMFLYVSLFFNILITVLFKSYIFLFLSIVNIYFQYCIKHTINYIKVEKLYFIDNRNYL